MDFSPSVGVFCLRSGYINPDSCLDGSNQFVANYLHGTKAFINKYWLVIHRTAGWGALRAWLLVSLTFADAFLPMLTFTKVLAVNRFLTGAQVAEVLRHYEKFTGMDYWCKIVPTERQPSLEV